MDFAHHPNESIANIVVTSGERATSGSPRTVYIAAGLLALGVALPLLTVNGKAAAQTTDDTVTAKVAIRKPLVAFSGPNSRIVTPSFERITSSKDWEALWKRHTGLPSSEYYDKSGLPRVNFEQCMVIAVFSGSSIANDGVSVISVNERPDKLVVSYTNRYMQIGMPPQDQLKNPRGAFGMFVLPRSVKPVVIGEYVRERKGATPVFKERTRLPARIPITITTAAAR